MPNKKGEPMRGVNKLIVSLVISITITPLSLMAVKSQEMLSNESELIIAVKNYKQNRQAALREIQEMLRDGANVNVRDRLGKTPLHYAMQLCSLPLVKLLIKYRANLQIQDKFGKTPLDILNEHPECEQYDAIKDFIENGE